MENQKCECFSPRISISITARSSELVELVVRYAMSIIPYPHVQSNSSIYTRVSFYVCM